MATTITFLRHAQTLYNETNRFCGSTDCDITSQGFLQAQQLHSVFSEFDVYYCSPLKRTHQTLRAIFPNATFIIDIRISEICLGIWEGREKNSVDQTLRNEFKKGNFAPEGAECSQNVEQRVLSFLKDIFSTYTNNEQILVVTHNGFLRTAAKLLGIEPICKNLEHFTISSDDYTDFR